MLLLAVRRLVREPDGARLMADPALAGLAYEVERRLLELEPALAKLEPGDEAAYATVREQLDEVGRPLAELVARAYDRFLSAAAASGRLATTLRRDLLVSLGLTGLSAVLLVGLVVSTVREARSARRRADRAASVAREAEGSLRTLVNALPVAVTAFDERGRVLLVNRHAAELAGIAEPAALGRDPTAIGLPAALSPAGSRDERGFREVDSTAPTAAAAISSRPPAGYCGRTARSPEPSTSPSTSPTGATPRNSSATWQNTTRSPGSPTATASFGLWSPCWPGRALAWPSISSTSTGLRRSTTVSAIRPATGSS